MALKNIPQAERLLSGTLTSYLSDVATTCVMSDPPSKFPTYIDLEPDSTTKKELIRAVAVSGSTVTIERSVNGVVTDHAANATYKQKITSRHWDAVSDALEKGLLMEDALRVLIRVSDTQFTITGYGASDDLTGTYTIGRVLRINSSASYVMTVTSSSYSAGTNKTTINVSATLPTPVSTVEFGIAPLGGTNLPLTSPVLTTPKVVTSINDENGNEVIKTPATTSAVNEVTVTNSATGVYPQISATGDDANIGLRIVSKGTEVIKLKSGDTPTYGHIVPSVADDTVALLAATQVLTNKTIASHLAYADTRYKVGSFTRAQDGTSADVSYTGIGFQPKAIIFMSTPAVTNMTTYSSWGFDDGTSHFGSVIRSAVNGPISGNSIFYGDGAAEQKGYIKTFDADGFTITWTKTGTPASGNIQVYFLALR